MSEWKEYKLSELAEITSSKRIFFADYVKSGVPFYRSKEIINKFNKQEIQTELFITEEKFEEIKEKFGVPVKDDILLTSVGTLGIPYLVTEKDYFYFKDGNLTWFRNIDKSKIDVSYFYIWLQSRIGKQKLDEISIGSTQAALTIAGLKSIEILLPELNEQKRIAIALNSIDAKINLLNSQNKTLEQISETLFRKWFAMEGESNTLVFLEEYVECINGVSYKSSELNPSKVGMVSLKSFNRDGGFNIEGFKEFTGRFKEKQVVVEGDLIVAHTDITQDADVIGNPALVIDNPNFEIMTISMDIVKVVPKVDWIGIEFLYFLMRTREFKNHCEGCANGSTVLHLNKQAIPTFEFPRPEKEKVLEFTRQSKELQKKFFSNHKQLRNLILLRDTLLPKLMNGEATIEN